jgi:hypothetical protein
MHAGAVAFATASRVKKNVGFGSMLSIKGLRRPPNGDSVS